MASIRFSSLCRGTWIPTTKEKKLMLTIPGRALATAASLLKMGEKSVGSRPGKHDMPTTNNANK
jgi:hypothetical protein